jgi:hypothetical protein
MVSTCWQLFTYMLEQRCGGIPLRRFGCITVRAKQRSHGALFNGIANDTIIEGNYELTVFTLDTIYKHNREPS